MLGAQQLSFIMPVLESTAWKYRLLEPNRGLVTKTTEGLGEAKLSALRPERKYWSV